MDAGLVLVQRNSLKGNTESKVSLFSDIIYLEYYGRFRQFEERMEVMSKAKSRQEKEILKHERAKSSMQGLEKGRGTSEHYGMTSRAAYHHSGGLNALGKGEKRILTEWQ